MLRLSILIDNLPSPRSCHLHSEHGLSVLIEWEKWHILCDMGASEHFLSNADHLGLSLDKLDYAFLSHGHADHTGGLCAFLTAIPNVPIVSSPLIFESHYFSTRHLGRRDISSPYQLQPADLPRFHFIDADCWLTPSVAIIKGSCTQYPTPQCNRFLSVGTKEHPETLPDLFEHEYCLAVTTPEGLVIISPCSHRGALNIISSCQTFTGEKRVKAFVGGLHFPDHPNVEDETTEFAIQFAQSFPETQLFSGHCTGPRAQQLLQQKLPRQIRFWHTGLQWEI